MNTLTNVPTTAQARPRASGGYMHGLDLLRVIASTVGVYVHTANWFAVNQREFSFSDFVRTVLADPLQLNPHLSFTDVTIFMVISGMVVTHVADRERPGQFLLRRFGRIIPLLVVVLVISAVLINLGVFRAETKQTSLSFLDVLTGVTLAGFFTTPTVILVGVTWTLLLQITFYSYVAATMPLLRRRPWLPPAAAAALICLTLSLASGPQSDAVHRIGVIACFITLIFIGQLITLVRSGKVHVGTGLAIGTVHFGLFVWADKLGGYAYSGGGMVRTAFLCILLVLVMMYVGGPVTKSAFVKAWSARTYAIYLIHPVCIYPTLAALAPQIGNVPALLVALLLTAAVTEVLHRYVEMAVHRRIRRWEKKRSTSAPAR
ncbi:acyltransferase [Lentzea sp. NPDC042327]|uniref:acyltransferase family protein n=1 Tax=Lentzea sp. NPDC042327 TaxID=3154801 RepID=UPI0033E698E8